MRNRGFALVSLMAAILIAGTGAWADNAEPHGHRPQGEATQFNVSVPTHPFDLILARPENNSVTLSVLAYEEMDGFVAYGSESGSGILQTPARRFAKGEPVELVLGGLKPDTAYHYRFQTRPPGGSAFATGTEGAFHTARPQGATFTFTMTADAHLDEHTSPEVYCRTLANIRADHPDFHIDLGNLFMTDKHASREEAAAQYLAQRYYLGQIGVSVPVLLALGVHDGENGKDDIPSPDSLAKWSNQMRRRYFSNPEPDRFYSGNPAPLQNYYAWEWGDALFVVLDPFRYSVRARGGGGDGWGWSLGQTQYQWLKQTLEQSRARFKCVFIHNLLYGNSAARGGIEVAGFNEWGGKNLDGSEGFKAHRPGWEMPIHQLLVAHHVAAVFKAHDNFYARQTLDGIVYQMVPQPSFAGNDRIRDLENYGYKDGTFLGNPGHVRVTVAPSQATVEYVRTNGEIAHHYVIPAP